MDIENRITPAVVGDEQNAAELMRYALDEARYLDETLSADHRPNRRRELALVVTKIDEARLWLGEALR